MKKIYRFLTSEEIIIISLSLILLACSYGPLVIKYLTPPLGKAFLGVFGFPPDFYGNLISFQEGQAGLWQLLYKTSSTAPAPPVWLKLEYRLLGRLSRLLPLDMTISFHLSRFFLSLILILVSYQLISTVFKEKSRRLAAFGLAFFSTAMGPMFNRLVYYWSPLSVFQRAAYFQHYSLSFILVLLAIIYLSQALERLDRKKLFWASFFGLLAGFVHAFGLISLFLTFPFYILLAKKKIPRLGFLIFFGLFSSLSLLYQFQIRHFRPWSLFQNIELSYNLISGIRPIDFILGIGPTLFLGLAGAYFAFKKRDRLNLLLAPWAGVYLVGFWFLWRFFKLNSARFLQTPFYIILGILSVYPIEALAKNRPKNILIITSLILLLSLPAWHFSLITNKTAYTNEKVYVSTDFLMAVDWLKRQGGQTDVFLAGENNSMIIAARAGLMPYMSTFSGQLPTYNLLRQNVNNFYTQIWNAKQAADFLKTEKIKFIFWGPEEKNFTFKTSLSYPFLQKVFDNPEVTIFKPVF